MALLGPLNGGVKIFLRIVTCRGSNFYFIEFYKVEEISVQRKTDIGSSGPLSFYGVIVVSVGNCA